VIKAGEDTTVCRVIQHGAGEFDLHLLGVGSGTTADTREADREPFPTGLVRKVWLLCVMFVTRGRVNRPPILFES